MLSAAGEDHEPNKSRRKNEGSSFHLDYFRSRDKSLAWTHPFPSLHVLRAAPLHRGSSLDRLGSARRRKSRSAIKKKSGPIQEAGAPGNLSCHSMRCSPGGIATAEKAIWAGTTS